MLGRTASNLFWMGRYMERAENVARLTEVGHRLSLTPDVGSGYREDWQATLATAGCPDPKAAGLHKLNAETVQRYLFFDRRNPSSVASCLEAARTNGRSVRTALTREVWEALNTAWIEFATFKPDDVRPDQLPELLDWVRQKTSLFRGAVQGTLLHDGGYRFLQLGNFIERADNTARILDTRYSVLLPTTEAAGGERGMHQWETMLRSVSAHRSYRHIYKDRYRPGLVAEFLQRHLAVEIAVGGAHRLGRGEQAERHRALLRIQPLARRRRARRKSQSPAHHRENARRLRGDGHGPARA
jgi:uncharacterized alpha-E superfamily protein